MKKVKTRTQKENSRGLFCDCFLYYKLKYSIVSSAETAATLPGLGGRLLILFGPSDIFFHVFSKI